MWRILVSLITVLGGAIAARTYSKPGAPAASPPPARPAGGDGRAAAEDARAPVPAPPALDKALHPGWRRARPERLPRPTYWPVVLALGVALIFWGIISIYFVAAAGAVLFVAGAAGWIGELIHESD